MHAPDLVEGILDRREELQHDDDERDGADRPGGAVARAGHKSVDQLNQLGIDLDVVVGRGRGGLQAGRGRRRLERGRGDHVALGGRVRRGDLGDFLVLGDLGGDKLDEPVEGVGGQVGIVLVDHEARDQDRDGDQRTQAQQRAEAEGGGPAESLVVLDAGEGDGNHPQQGEEMPAQRIVLQVVGVPNPLGAKLDQLMPAFDQTGHKAVGISGSAGSRSSPPCRQGPGGWRTGPGSG